MSDTPNVESITASIKQAVQDAYERGRVDGAREMRNAIMEAAKLPDVSFEDEDTSTDEEDERVARAPRGVVTQAIDNVLTGAPGRTIKELELAVVSYDHRVSIKSVGNTLRRLENQRYLRQGDKWFLMSHAAQNNSAGVAINESPAGSVDMS